MDSLLEMLMEACYRCQSKYGCKEEDLMFTLSVKSYDRLIAETLPYRGVHDSIHTIAGIPYKIVIDAGEFMACTILVEKAQGGYMDGSLKDKGNACIMQMWHRIDGKWMYIEQITKDGIREYYTDGKLTEVRKVNKDGTVFINEHS